MDHHSMCLQDSQKDRVLQIRRKKVVSVNGGKEEVVYDSVLNSLPNSCLVQNETAYSNDLVWYMGFLTFKHEGATRVQILNQCNNMKLSAVQQIDSKEASRDGRDPDMGWEGESEINEYYNFVQDSASYVLFDEFGFPSCHFICKLEIKI